LPQQQITLLEIKKPRRLPGGAFAFLAKLILTFADVSCLQAFRAVDNIKGYCLTFSEGFEAFADDCGEVYENIFAILLLDETKTLRIIEPLDFSLCHLPLSLLAPVKFCRTVFVLQLPES
jgi:hypothetical protein